MPGEVLISVHVLLAIRNALIACDQNEAYHELLKAADPGNRNALQHDGNHWKSWEDIAAAVPDAHT